MMKDEKLNLLIFACISGFFGDAGLQLLTKKMGMGGPTGWGLKPYFLQHGSAEALFIAGGMLTVFYIIYLFIFQLPPTWSYLTIYGILLDLFFRETMLFSSLEGYYNHLNYFWSAFWGAIPMLLPLIIIHFTGPYFIST
jgi:hypothetical protein